MKVVFLCIIIQRFHLSHKVPHPTSDYYTRANRRRIHPNLTIRRRICPKALSFTMPITRGLTPDPTSEDGSFFAQYIAKRFNLLCIEQSCKSMCPAIRTPCHSAAGSSPRPPTPIHPPPYIYPLCVKVCWSMRYRSVSRFAGVCQAC